MNKQNASTESGREYRGDQEKAALVAPDCYLAAWYAYNLQIGGGMATVLTWGQQAMSESGVTDISASGAFAVGTGPNGQRVRAFSQNLDCTPPGGGVGIPCFAALAVADTNVNEANSLNDTISQKWAQKLGIS